MADLDVRERRPDRRDRWPGDELARSYDAARIASRTRDALIAARSPFIAETVFSHPSKLDLIRAATAAGYYVALHVVVVPVELSVARVAARMDAGGHDVPEAKIRERHDRLWDNVFAAVPLVDTTTFWDNSRHTGPEIVVVYAGGIANGPLRWPSWTPATLT